MEEDAECENCEETNPFMSSPPSPSRADSRLRGRIMATGYRYKLLEDPDAEDSRGQLDSMQCRSKTLGASLFLVCLLFLTMLVVFVIVLTNDHRHRDYGSTSNAHQLCLTPNCVETSATILKKMDPSVDPCRDIYRYACGGWVEDTVLPPDHYKMTMFNEASTKNEEFLRQILDDKSTEFKGHNSSAMAKLKTAYRSCMNKTALDRIGTSRLVELINRLGSWTVVSKVNNISAWSPDQWRLQEVVEQSHKLWSSGLFTYEMEVDSKNTQRYIMEFSQSGLSLAYPKRYLNNSEKFEQGFLDFATEVAVLLGGNATHARSKMQEVYNLEKQLAEVFVKREQMTSPFDVYHKMTLAELQTLIGSWIDLKRYLKATFNGRDFPDTEDVLVRTPSFFGNLSSIVEGADKEVLANYLMWFSIKGFLRYLPVRFSEAWLHLAKVEIGTTDLPERWKTCTSYAKGVAGFAGSAIYVDAKFTSADKTKVLQTVDTIRKNFMENLDTVQWLDDQTRGRLRDKADAISLKVGYPDWILDPQQLDDYYEKLNQEEEELFANRISAIEFITSKATDKYETVPDKKEWSAFPITVNGYYSPNYNTIIMPAGILQPPFFSSNYPKPFLYSTLGIVVGHELTHAFDNSGRMYDKHGNLGNQWTSSVSKMYKEQASCFEKQYGKYSLQGVHVNGKTTLDENIADNGGIRLAFQAYKRDSHTETWTLPGVNLTNDQLFFIGFAQAMCSIYTPEYQLEAIATDEHSYPEFRIKGMYANMPQFFEVFNCPQAKEEGFGQDMCRVW